MVMWTTEVDDAVNTEHKSLKSYVVEELKENLEAITIFLPFFHNNFCFMIKDNEQFQLRLWNVSVLQQILYKIF
jgi:hypothetical protein